MSFDKQWDEKELMLKGLLNHPYKDLGKFKEDLITYMNYKYDEENLAIEWARHSEYGDPNRSIEYHKENCLQHIKEDTWDDLEKFNVSEIAKDISYLEKNNLLDDTGEVPGSSKEKIISGNLSMFASKIIEEWFKTKEDELVWPSWRPHGKKS